MNISDLSVDTLIQLEARMTADLEMVKRVKALVVEYQKMGGHSPITRTASLLAAGAAAPAGAPADSSATPIQAPVLKPAEERLTEALATLPAAGFILDDLSRATYSPYGCIGKDAIKVWVKRMVRQGKVRVVETRAGRIGSVYAAILPKPTGGES